MNDVVTMRLPEAVIKELEGIAKAEYLDMVTLIRKMLLEEYLLKRSAERYRECRISIEEAAAIGKVSVWGMIEYLRDNNINPPPEDLAAMEEGLARTEKILMAK